MLSAEQIEALGSRAESITAQITDFLIQDIAERISQAGQFTSTASYEIWRLQNLGVSQKELKKKLQKLLNKSAGEIEDLLTQSAETGYNFDISRFPTVDAIPFAENTSLQQIVAAAVKLAQEDFTNIVKTTGFVGSDGVVRELTDAYRQACDFAFMKTVTGAQDYTSAIRDATRNLAEKGIRYIDYKRGKHMSLEAAVRTSVMGGMGLMQEQIAQQNHDDLGCDGWEISAHSASAPDHEPIQGKQYTDSEYTRLNNSLRRRIGTLFCGHFASGIILGVHSPQYTPEELEQMRLDNEKGVTVDGQHYTMYQATQRQRKFERSIRDRKRRILIDEKTGDTEKLQTDQIRLVRLRQEYARFSDAAGLPMQHARAEKAGFTWKHGKAAERAARAAQQPSTKKVEFSDKYGTMKTIPTNGTDSGAAKNGGVADLQYVTRLDIEKYKCVAEDITTDEVIITDERIQHIKERHPNDYERFSAYIPEAIKNPDYIIQDKQPATAMVLKRIEESGEHFRLAIRLATSSDNPEYKNSVLTFLKIREKEWRRLINNKNILYKAE